MGTYLSTPVKDKCEESGDQLDCPQVPCRWGVVDMQGWRKNMEDAHLAATDIPLPEYLAKDDETAAGDAKVFGVFDGHGGPEVARFCSLYLISVLTQQSAWTNTDTTNNGDSSQDPQNPATYGVGKALVTAFHAMDRLIDDPVNRCVMY
jgi:serine/threonine protein phosphatase PrpC